MILFGVQDAKHDHAIRFHEVGHFVGKTAGQQATELTIIEGPPFRSFFERLYRLTHRSHQFITQALSLFLVPSTSLPQICLGARPDENPSLHSPDGSRNRASTSAQVEPALGFF
jgi:hypothetical protein